MIENINFTIVHFFLEMARIFQSCHLQKEFEKLYRVLLVSLNDCGACRLAKCSSCASCRKRSCKTCVKFFNSLNFLYKNSTAEQCDYICNFLPDFFRLHINTKEYFFDVSAPIQTIIKDNDFVISDASNRALLTNNGKKKILLAVIYNNFFHLV